MQLHSERGVLPCIRALEDITPCVASPQPVSELRSADPKRPGNRRDGQNICSRKSILGLLSKAVSIHFSPPSNSIIPAKRSDSSTFNSAVWRRSNVPPPLCNSRSVETRSRQNMAGFLFQFNFELIRDWSNKLNPIFLQNFQLKNISYV